MHQWHKRVEAKGKTMIDLFNSKKFLRNFILFSVIDILGSIPIIIDLRKIEDKP